MTVNKNNIRLKFPYFQNCKKSIYFDNAATTHKPKEVIDSIVDFYSYKNSNIHRSTHKASASLTENYENVRECVKDFIQARFSEEIIFTSGTTESINMVAESYVKHIVGFGDIIYVSPIEHHANIVPWQILAKKSGATLKALPIDENMKIDLKKIKFSSKVKFIACHHVSNVTGIAQDIKSLIKLAKKFHIPVLVDGAQAISHMKIDVVDLDCDFYCFSGHKIYAPTGSGVLYGKKKLLQKFTPYKYGGGMVNDVRFKTSSWGDLPQKLEAGTQNIAGVIGLGAAINFIKDYGLNNIWAKENELSKHMQDEINKIPELINYGQSNIKAPIFSFNIANIHHYDVSTLLSENNIFIRSGHLCNQNIMQHLNTTGCVRASLCFYNNISEINSFIKVLHRVISILEK